MKRKDLYMGSTEIEVIRTMGEIQSLLVRAGAIQILTTYDEKTKEPSGLHFVLNVKGMSVPFQLPARVEPIFKIIYGDGWQRNRQKDMEQAKRVAWRQLYRWIQAQTGLIETGMVAVEEVFMPYLQVGPNQTLYQRAVEGGFERLALPEKTA
jgi:hypothetical protein